jgi:hypothetical protein
VQFDNLAKVIKNDSVFRKKWKVINSCDDDEDGPELQCWAPTRRNPGFDWLDGWLSFESKVSQFVRENDFNELQNCALGPKDWELAKHVSQGLAVGSIILLLSS